MMTTDIELAVESVLARVNKGVALSAVLKDIEPVHRVPSTGVVDLPEAKPLTEDALHAMVTLPNTMKLAIEMTPIERRKLNLLELEVLMTERETLDKVRKAIDARLADQKKAVANHHDIMLEETPGFDPDDYDVDADGHYMTKSQLPVPGHAKGYVRQLRQGSPSVTAESLRLVVDQDEEDPEGFTYQDWLNCTSPVRVLDEAKTAMQMRKNPTKVVEALRRAIVPGKSITAHALG